MTVRYVYDGDTLRLQHATPNRVVTTTNPTRVWSSVWTDDGRFVAGELVSSGAATAIRVWPNVANHPYLSALEERAVAARTGRWGSC